MTRIAICAPATPITRDDAEAVTRIAAAEFPQLALDFHPQCFLSEGHFAGSEQQRLSAFLECANDPAAAAVWFAKGGYGSNAIAGRAVEGLDSAGGAKTFLGYSDNGYLLAALYRAGMGRPVHGPMPVDVRRDGGETAIRRALGYLAGDLSQGLEPATDDRPAVAFNLMTLAMLTGTDLLPDLSGHVVMVEEVAEHLYAVDRLFFHVTHTLKDIAGLRLGEVSEVPENDRAFGRGAEDIARYWCGRTGIPYLGRAEIGHCSSNRIVPFGVAAKRTDA
ncbi:LD-carboxypeptidase [Tsuneonella sp. YG55]|uniref:LD-carboxypeptidase n=1 Tax=Tsuneonella litorea TaxID=2976475 RepID=A0A9X2VZJ9_9SPHN|nr:LD-carboxypeptidase [Tsuneonella litorea]MCT2558158.1 LD-carboxypeptidase [Tsuneonella litorea]